nr:immediate early response gene 5-like protein [Onthophagus taurus]
MASEAQRLIGISLTKIAQSRTNRAGVSLHKNLLVATVLQKARFIFMEEAYNMVHYQTPITSVQPMMPISYQQTINNDEQEDLVAVTAEEVGIEPTPTPGNAEETNNLDFLQPSSCEKCTENQNKENQPPISSSSPPTQPTATTTELTYLDLDKTNLLRNSTSPTSCLKRRRAVSDWETEEAVQSILPKKSKSEDGDDSVFLDDATILSETISKEVQEQQQKEENSTTNSGSAMEIDRITSLVSIFSFGVGGGGGEQKLTRSMSTPDLCSSQAKDPGNDVLQQRPFLAMTV